MTTRQTPDAVREAVARETLAKQYDASMPSRAAHIRAGTSDHKAIDAILAFAALDSRAGDADEFATVEEWEHDDQRELSRLYIHKAHDGPQFNRGQMRVAIRHGKRLAAPAVDAVPAGEVERTLAAGRIIDIMTGGKFDWRSRLEESDFLESADWLTALAYADAARPSGEVTRLRQVLRAVRDDLHNENGLNLHSITDTIWHGPAETTVDFIDAALSRGEGRK